MPSLPAPVTLDSSPNAASAASALGTTSSADLSAFARALLEERIRIAEELERRGLRPRRDALALEADWRVWLPALFPQVVKAGFADRHVTFWEWVWALRVGEAPDALVAIWPRGGAKSSSAEMACVAIGARGVRRYGLYVCETQPQADKHVESVGALLESGAVARYYPAMGERAVGKYGSSKGWRRNRLSTASGFTLDAIGLDTAARGIKREELRPGFIVVDDIDGRHDSAVTIEKKIEALTDNILPTGEMSDLAVLAVQNLIHDDSIFSRLAGLSPNRADFLAKRIISGPFPAVVGMETRRTDDGRDEIIAGTPTWAGQDLAACQHAIDTYGLSSFLRESQQDVARDPDAALWRREWIESNRVGVVGKPAAPDSDTYTRIVVAIDPSSSADGTGDACGIVVVALGADEHGYVLEDDTLNGSPDEWARTALFAWARYRAFAPCTLVYEANQGGAAVERTLSLTAAEMVREGVLPATPPTPIGVHASKGKEVRAAPIAALAQQGRIHHSSVLPMLENELCRWTPGNPSPNRLDAYVWGLSRLLLRPPREKPSLIW